MGLGKTLNSLCKDPFTQGLVTDKASFYKAANKLLDHKRQGGRASGGHMLADMPIEDFHLVGEKLVHIIKDKDDTYHSYHNPGGPVGAAINVLAHLNIKEGIPYAMDIVNQPSGKGSFKMKARWAALGAYGANAKPQMELLEAEILNNGRGGLKALGKHKRAWDSMVKKIEGDQNPSPLITFEQAMQAGK